MLAPIFLSTFHGPGIVTDGDTAMKIKQNKAKQIKLCSHRTHILIVCRPTANKQKYKYMSHDDKCYKEKLSWEDRSRGAGTFLYRAIREGFVHVVTFEQL